MYMREKFLPIGTVVLLKGGEKKLMITSYLIFGPGEGTSRKVFDYGSCTYPEGVIDSSHAVGFNHSDIEKIVFLGHEDEDQINLNNLLKQSADEIKSKIENGEL